MQAHVDASTGWSERTHISVHEWPEHAKMTMADWLTAQLQACAIKPHLCLLIPGSTTNAHAAELQLRGVLTDAGHAFQVLYGVSLQERIINAANAIALTAKAVLPSGDNACFALTDTSRPVHPRMRSWSCEKCSDPECEHRLFTGLVTA